MARLPHEMTSDILCRLSVKDLLRFRSVSKPWCRTIDDPYFIKLHLSHSLKTNTNLSLILSHGEDNFFSVNCALFETTQRLNHPFGEQRKTLQILGSCNGLLALVDDRDRIFLWNPSTRKFQVLPFSEIGFSSPSSTYYGFGYDPISDDYKLIRMVQSHGNNDEYFHSEAKVYSLRSNCWRRIKDVCFYHKFSREFGFLANNALHWMVFKTPQSRNQELVGFDLGSEEFRFLELPECRLDKVLWFHINAVGGDICLTSTYRETDNVVVDVWIMKEYGVKQSWFKLISWKEPHFMPWSTVALPLALAKDGGKVLFFIEYKWFNRGRRVDSFVWYDLRSQEVENVVIRDIPTSFEVNWYVDSLVPLNSNA
ncbi:hypothetical protein E1A91_D08G021400v1 [Gossypium mustelinum]|uniref:F-box domain-containing protein n=3 Tax=Gossypium TaxID=3633 RepID=A0A5J5QAR9_GOSBA|nr:hypothetical protein ES319_D08G020700v1 [Gossypium barbadense]TYG55919.1 hypothetical protein ES288_D08G021900v1 [Gossypium darwinii]TYI67490.1 hypothetical protein E1A91_D08G021400v1 [Gossypium mustelinum]